MINLHEKDVPVGKLSLNVKTVYIIAPMTIYKDTQQYHEVVNNFKRLNQSVKFLLPDSLYVDNEDFRQNMTKHIKKADVGILLSDKGVIGYGCYTEMQALHIAKKPVCYYRQGRLHKYFLVNILQENNWVRYATVKGI